ncbi:MAG TPA: sulfotransferase domain-containing protein [Candidatus Binataceae bacterium]|nr:sulfotransferase domain-containing protein [Candidatus Binataceae bacterium]
MGQTEPVVIDGAGENSVPRNPASHQTRRFSGKTRPLGRLPDFIAVGPPRTGTTWLDKVLRGRVTLPNRVKETLFFKSRYWRGINWYAHHFELDTGMPAGEFGPTYFAPEIARRRIKQHIPNCKIICTFRDPADRLYSNYQLWRHFAMVKFSFEEVAFTDRDMNLYSQYGTNLRGFIDLFGRENVLVLIHEDISTDRQGYLDKVCSFIGIPWIDADLLPGINDRINHVAYAPKRRKMARRVRKINARLADHAMYRSQALLKPLFDRLVGKGAQFPPLDPDMRIRVRAHMRPEVERLEELIQRDLSHWK